MKIYSPAKINLFLMVKGKRTDGYHELVTLLCRINLCDVISLEFNHGDITCCCTDPHVPSDETNLAHRAATLFFSNLKKRAPFSGVKISIEKNIPIGAGLGGGSSNAASVLLGLNSQYHHLFSLDDLMVMGREIGADVPFFLFKKPAIATGVGEKLREYKGLMPYKTLVVYPKKNISTRTVYKNLNLGLTKCKQKLNCFFFKNEAFRVPDHLCNDLELVTGALCPEIYLIKQILMDEKADGSLMSGSGSGVFGLFSDEKAAQQVYCRLSENRSWQVFLTDLMV